MATTVTETYTVEQNEGDTIFPSTARARQAAELASGAIVSNTLTPIIHPSEEVVAGKTKYRIVRVYRSAEDKARIAAATNADAELQAYLISSGYRQINKVIS
jgi:hypothetical protein